ncbi:MAG: hypothetical protein HYY63_05035 [Elusimicrobia bacterium]|nr:hypothetical protein [Elusimicrobiota bacterium]
MEGLEVDQFSLGFLLGILVGEGHFGGDGRQPQVTLRMHVRHKNLFEWLLRIVPGSKLYGPYNHSGREYYQWMVRGEPLRQYLAPLLQKTSLRYLAPYHYDRFQKMVEKYHIELNPTFALGCIRSS